MCYKASTCLGKGMKKLKEEKRSGCSSFNENLDVNYNVSSMSVQEYNDTIEFRKIKELICEEHLEYVTEYLRRLLKIKKTNNPMCFKKSLFKELFSTNEYGNRVIIYVRLSVEDLERTEGNVSKSILNQLLMLLTYCRDKQLELVGIFYEEDISGSDETREEWNKSLLFCELGNTNIYICKSQSRFARSIEFVEKYLHKKFIEWNIRFLSLVDNIDTNNRNNKKSSQITAMTDEWKIEEQSISTKRTLRAKNDAGQWMGSFAPYGYIEDPNDMYHIVVDEPAAKVVRKIYEMYASGCGYHKICEYLNEKKIPTPSRYKKLQGSNYVCPSAPNGSEFWNHDTVRKILQDETYDGILVQHRTESISYNIKGRKKIPKNEQSIVACAHERIVDVNISRIVRKKFKDRKEREKIKEASREANILINAIEDAKKEYKNSDKNVIADINIGISKLKDAILTSNLEDIVDTYNSLRELTVSLSSTLYSAIQDKVQVLTTAKTRARPGKNGKVHIFSQKVYCKCCGKVFQKNQYKTGPRKSEVKQYKDYLVCKTRKRVGEMACDNNGSIRYEALEEFVLGEINKMIERYYDKSKLESSYYEKKVNSNYDKDIASLEKERKDLEKQIKTNKEKITMLYDDRTTGILTPEEFVMLKNKYQNDNEKYQKRIEQINVEVIELEQKKAEDKDESEIFEEYRNIKKLDKIVVDTFISKIIIGKKDPETGKRDIKIIWNFAV